MGAAIAGRLLIRLKPNSWTKPGEQSTARVGKNMDKKAEHQREDRGLVPLKESSSDF